MGRVAAGAGASVAALVLAWSLAAGPAAALLGSSTSGSVAVSLDTLAPASGLTAAVRCKKPASVTLRWTASPSGYVTGYVVSRAVAGSGAWAVVATVSATSYTDATVAKKTVYDYRVQAGYRAWTSAPVGVTTTKKC